MPTKPAESSTESNLDNQESSLDPQKKYLMDQFGNLMEKVGDGFGGPLQEELINRLEQTIADFHEEVNEMMANLKENAEKRHEKLKEIWNNPDASVVEMDNQTKGPSNDESVSEMSDWERRLEEAGKLGDSGSSDSKTEPAEEAPKKKGLFGRKKK
ncbi:MAG: hypothetical protein CMF94_02490 [Candidatus Marinimicrobia bacterium]|nr:hypothetical protein [Candidatus Neomarinimicrobiota bacterium]